MVNESVEQQSNNAQHINSAITGLSEEMEQTRDSLHETYSAIEQLNDAARELQEEVSQFKVT
jgi:methyl-accepting chemotaxis protein WspA